MFSGGGGLLLSASDASAFVCGLVDCGDGFDWRCPDVARSFWVGHPVFRVDGVPVVPLQVWPESGRVSFAVCLRGREVVTEGVCRPVAAAAEGSSWRLRLAFPLADTTVLADGFSSRRTVEDRSAVVELTDVSWRLPVDAVSGDVVVRLPYGAGLFVGVGGLRGGSDTGPVIDLCEGMCRYVLC